MTQNNNLSSQNPPHNTDNPDDSVRISRQAINPSRVHCHKVQVIYHLLLIPSFETRQNSWLLLCHPDIFSLSPFTIESFICPMAAQILTLTTVVCVCVSDSKDATQISPVGSQIPHFWHIEPSSTSKLASFSSSLFTSHFLLTTVGFGPQKWKIARQMHSQWKYLIFSPTAAAIQVLLRSIPKFSRKSGLRKIKENPMRPEEVYECTTMLDRNHLPNSTKSMKKWSWLRAEELFRTQCYCWTSKLKQLGKKQDPTVLTLFCFYFYNSIFCIVCDSISDTFFVLFHVLLNALFIGCLVLFDFTLYNQTWVSLRRAVY